MVRPDRATIVPSGVGETFLVVSTSPHPEQSKRSITFTNPSGVFYKSSNLLNSGEKRKRKSILQKLAKMRNEKSNLGYYREMRIKIIIWSRIAAINKKEIWKKETARAYTIIIYEIWQWQCRNWNRHVLACMRVCACREFDLWQKQTYWAKPTCSTFIISK